MNTRIEARLASMEGKIDDLLVEIKQVEKNMKEMKDILSPPFVPPWYAPNPLPINEMQGVPFGPDDILYWSPRK